MKKIKNKSAERKVLFVGAIKIKFEPNEIVSFDDQTANFLVEEFNFLESEDGVQQIQELISTEIELVGDQQLLIEKKKKKKNK